MLVNLKFEEPIIGEPTNEQLAEAANIGWYSTDSNMYSLLQQGYIVDHNRTRVTTQALRSLTDLGGNLIFASCSGVGAKIIENPTSNLEAHHRLAESLRSTEAKHPVGTSSIPFGGSTDERNKSSQSPLTISKLRLSFLAGMADDIARLPGKEVPSQTIDMTSLALAGFTKRFQMRKQLKPYEIALRAWKSGNVMSYAEPQQEITKALHVTPELWHNGISQVAADVLATQQLVKEQKESMSQGHHSSTEVTYWKAANEEMERSLAFNVLDIVRLRLEAEQKIEIRDAHRYRSSPYGFATTKRPRFIS